MTKRPSLATVVPKPARGLGGLCPALFLAFGASGKPDRRWVGLDVADELD